MRGKLEATLAFAACVAWTARARAVDGALSLEAGAGQSQQGPTIPTSVYEYQRVSGQLEPGGGRRPRGVRENAALVAIARSGPAQRPQVREQVGHLAVGRHG